MGVFDFLFGGDKGWNYSDLQSEKRGSMRNC
jgi:hypothetical protein